jgi:hypothetical protein
MVPMHTQKRKEAFHEPGGSEALVAERRYAEPKNLEKVAPSVRAGLRQPVTQGSRVAATLGFGTQPPLGLVGARLPVVS